MSHPIARRAGMLALTAAMLMPSAGALSDVSSWAQEGVAAAQNAGLAPSSLSNSAASGSITRAEFCAVALNAYKAVSGKAVYVSGKKPFEDCSDPNVTAAYLLGIIKGRTNGNFDPDAALRLCDEILQPAAPITVERAYVSEPEAVRTHRVDVSMPVATTMFQVGFKGVSADEKTNYENQIIDEVINEIVAGEGSALYRELYDQGLINNTFGTEVMCGRDYMALIFGGESKDPDKVYEAICREFDRLKTEGVSAADFERCKKALYGKYIGIFSSSSSIATVMMETHFFGLGAFDVLEVLSGLTLEQLEARLRENVDTARSALSIVRPMA